MCKCTLKELFSYWFSYNLHFAIVKKGYISCDKQQQSQKLSLVGSIRMFARCANLFGRNSMQLSISSSLVRPDVIFQVILHTYLQISTISEQVCRLISIALERACLQMPTYAEQTYQKMATTWHTKACDEQLPCSLPIEAIRLTIRGQLSKASLFIKGSAQHFQ